MTASIRGAAALAALACAFAIGTQSYAQQLPPGQDQGQAGSAGESPFVERMVDGVGLEQWTARWWRWAHGQPIPPYLDRDGRLCDFGQAGPVWFLAGTDGSFEPRRDCVVPEGKHLLLPVINMIYWQQVPGGSPCSELQRGASVNNDRLSSAVVLLNGQSLGDIRLRRVRSGCFAMDPDDPESVLAAADGYWVMLKPLPRGRHTLVVAANYGGAGARGYANLRQNFEYVLHVGAPVLISAR
jgi:hypothetical protein